MIRTDAPVSLAGSRWLDIERRWPLWTAARQRQAAIAALDQAVCSLPEGASLVAEIFGADLTAPRSVRPVMEFGAELRRRLRGLQTLSVRSRSGADARLFRRAATVVGNLVRLMEEVADLQVSLQITTAGPASRRLSHLLLDMSRLVADAWMRARSGAIYSFAAWRERTRKPVGSARRSAAPPAMAQGGGHSSSRRTRSSGARSGRSRC